MNVLVTLGSTAHYGYHESTIETLCRRGHAVRILFAKEGGVSPLARVLDRAPRDCDGSLDFGWITPRSDRWRRLAFPVRALRSYSNYLGHQEQSDYYRRRWERHLGPRLEGPARRPSVRRVLATKPVFRGLGAVERLVPPAKAIVRELRSERPDVVVASPANLWHPQEIEYVKAARRLRIPTVVPVLSWDNLTTKGLIHVTPDLTLVWNDTQRDEAVSMHGIPSGRIAVTGSPFFDPWFQASREGEQRDPFCRRVGLDPQHPFAVYLGSSANIATDETWLIRAIAGALRRAADPELRSMQLLARPHPANAGVYAELDEPNVVVWPKAGRLPDSDDSRREFRATLQHAVAGMGINTSGMIDAVIADRPCVAVVVPEYDATQRQAVHFTHLLRANTLELADGAESCAELLLALSRGADSTRDARRRFVETFVRPRGIAASAGALAAYAIELAAERLPGSVIDERLTEVAKDDALSAARPTALRGITA